MQQWEYLVVDVASSGWLVNRLVLREEHLDDLGAEGWELCGAIPYRLFNNRHKLLFKRPVMDD